MRISTETQQLIYLIIGIVILWLTSFPLPSPPFVPSAEPREPVCEVKKEIPTEMRIHPTRQCFISKGERKIKEVLNTLYVNSKFTKVRPDWLKNPKTNRNLELDFFNPELKIAVEYNGEQHYTYKPFFHKSELDFQEQVYRDKLKKRLCAENGVILVVVPFTIKLNDIETYIRDEIKLQTLPKIST